MLPLALFIKLSLPFQEISRQKNQANEEEESAEKAKEKETEIDSEEKNQKSVKLNLKFKRNHLKMMKRALRIAKLHKL